MAEAALRLEETTYTTQAASGRGQGGLGFVGGSRGFAVIERRCDQLFNVHFTEPPEPRDGVDTFSVGWLATEPFVLYDAVPLPRQDRSRPGEFTAQVFASPYRWSGSWLALGRLVARRVTTGQRLDELLGPDRAVDGWSGPDGDAAWPGTEHATAICRAVCGLANSRPADLDVPVGQVEQVITTIQSLMTRASAAEVSAWLTSVDGDVVRLSLRSIERSSLPTQLHADMPGLLEASATDEARWQLLQHGRRQIATWTEWQEVVRAVGTVDEADEASQALLDDVVGNLRSGGAPDQAAPPAWSAPAVATPHSTHVAPMKSPLIEARTRLKAPPALQEGGASVSPAPAPHRYTRQVDHAKAILHALATRDGPRAIAELRSAQADRLGPSVLQEMARRDLRATPPFGFLGNDTLLSLAADMERSQRVDVLFGLLPTNLDQLAHLAAQDRTYLLAARLCSLAAMSAVTGSTRDARRTIPDLLLRRGLDRYGEISAGAVNNTDMADVVLSLCECRESDLPLQWAWETSAFDRAELCRVVDELARHNHDAREFLRNNLESFLAVTYSPDVMRQISSVLKVQKTTWRVATPGRRKQR